MTDLQYEAKFQEMQKYVPFLERVIEKLKVNNEQQEENPRKAQLQKMEMLHELLTNKSKKIKMETLVKCEGVLIKLHTKIEKNEDSILNTVKLKQTAIKPSTITIQNAKDEEIVDDLGPASPPPEVIPIDMDQPVVIPTERRCSPILSEKVSTSFNKASAHHSKVEEIPDNYKKSSDKEHSADSNFQNLRQKAFNSDSNQEDNGSNRHIPRPDKHDYHRRHYNHFDSRKDDYNIKDNHPISTHISTNRINSPLPKEDKYLNNKPSASSLHTVKVVITEHLPDHVKQQHFPSSSKFTPKTSVCHNILKTPQASVKGANNNEAYSPEELWDEYNDSNKKQPKGPIFSRLGDKIVEKSLSSCHTDAASTCISGRYTPIPDVLKSPPLSATDINNLLLESGLEKMSKDISEIGTRRPPKTDDSQKRIDSSPTNSLEFVRKKLAQTAKLHSPSAESQKSSLDKANCASSTQPQERIALKYNPHPRQERLQSISLTDGNECSIQTKITDPRIKSKLAPSNLLSSMTPVSTVNVNVLPTINMSDPRLKKQNIASSVIKTPESVNILAAPLMSGQNQTPPSYINRNTMNYSRKVDPRLSRVPSNPLSGHRTIPDRRQGTNQSYYNSEEIWNSESEGNGGPSFKINYRFDKKNHPGVKCRFGDRSFKPGEKTRLPTKNDPRRERRNSSRVVNKFENNMDSRFSTGKNVLPKPALNRKVSISQPRFKSGSDNISEMGYVKPNPPKSDSEENWDTDSENDMKIPEDKPAPMDSGDQVEPKTSSNPKSKNKNEFRNNYSRRLPNSNTEEDWDLESEPICSNTKPKTSINAPLHIIKDKPPIPELISPVYLQVSPIPFGNPIHNSLLAMSPQHLLQNPYGRIQHPVVGPNISLPMQNSAANNRFNALLNDKSERIKYFESKKQKSTEPRTYKEFREAKEREQIQAAAIRRTAEETEAMKRTEELKEITKGKEINTCNKNEQKLNAASKISESGNVEKKLNQVGSNMKLMPSNKDHVKSLALESTLDKMYRTQSFGLNFPKPNTSFKIPKKKTEEKAKDETTGNIIIENKLLIETPTDCIKGGDTATTTKSNNIENMTTEIPLSENITKEQSKDDLKGKTEGTSTNKKANKASNDKSKENLNKETESKTIELPVEKSKNENEMNEIVTEEKFSTEGNNIRDPRYKFKGLTNQKPDGFEEDKSDENNSMVFKDIIIKSSENQVVLKPQQKSSNLEEQNMSAIDKFNKITQTLCPKPQRILRRRNTMVAFESDPLVDKDKLMKANAMLFEDVQEQEKRKQKQAEEDRQNARRSKHLEEIFQKTDDNCTVSTQNIISGKRRTRATINFNETANAINVFKHISKKDIAGNSNSTSLSSSQTNKSPRSNLKSKLKNAEISNTKRYKSDENNIEIHKYFQNKASNETITSEDNKEVKTNSSGAKNQSTSGINIKFGDGTKTKKVCIKLVKKRPIIANKILPLTGATTNSADKQMPAVSNKDKIKSVQDDEHQNCAVSSTSTETPLEDQLVCSSNSTISCSFKEEIDDNEPTSTANKSNNPTPTPETGIHVLNEIVDQILKPNADREHILGLLGQILSEERLEHIKSLIESNNQENEERATNREEGNKTEEKIEEMGAVEIKISTKTKEQENRGCKEEMPSEANKSLEDVKKAPPPKKKRSELDRLNEDIRDMFICEGVLTATGRRMCTIMGQSNNNKDTDTVTQNKHIQESSSLDVNENDNVTKKKDQKPYIEKAKVSSAKHPRRSVRGYKTSNGEIDDDDIETHSIYSRTTEDSIDETNITTDFNNTDSTFRRKMPVLKPNNPIKTPEEDEEVHKDKIALKGIKNKRKSNIKNFPKSKRMRTSKNNYSKDDADSESEKGSGTEEENENKNVIKNTNVHWHNQSKFTTWCMICKKKILANTSAFHYKMHHGENYVSRLAPVLLQQFKQRKLSRPIFGVNKKPKQSSWFYRCPFCLQYFNTTLPLWLEHFQNHTTEFRYECSKCHRGSNRAATTRRHIKKCEGATMINSAVKLSIPTLIEAHVCHLCNFIQLKRDNLERHYIEQHHLDRKTVELLGYTITLFDVENVELVSEDKASEREEEVLESVEKEGEVIDIDGDDRDKNAKEEIQNKKSTTSNVTESGGSIGSLEPKNLENVVIESNNNDIKKDVRKSRKEVKGSEESFESNNGESVKNEIPSKSVHTKGNINRKKLSNKGRKNTSRNTQGKSKTKVISVELIKEDSNTKNESNKQSNNSKINIKVENSLQDSESQKQNKTKSAIKIDDRTNVQSQCVESSSKKEDNIRNIVFSETKASNLSCELSSEKETIQGMQNEQLTLAVKVTENTNESKSKNNGLQSQTTMSDIISSSIDMIYNCSDKRKSTEEESCEAKKTCQNIVSNVFMPTRDENNSSPTIQILAQSIINIEEEANQAENPLKERVSISIAERLSQRFKGLQNETINSSQSNISATTQTNAKPKQNIYEKLINDTILGLEEDNDSAATCNQSTTELQTIAEFKENEDIKKTVVELEKCTKKEKDITQVPRQKEISEVPKDIQSSPLSDTITVISDDEDWEDIEITETAPAATSTTSGNIQKSKNKGLFQKFGIFKGSNIKSKKHLPSMVFLPKKKTKEKTLQTSTTSSPSPTTTIKHNSTTLSANKSEAQHTNANINLGFKPVVNIMDDLLPDSPCNDPIDLVPELAPLEPLQDLNDISSILDSNLSALEASVNINASDNHASIEDALDFISEEQASDTQKLNSLSLKPFTQTQGKTIINNISHVGYSVQSSREDVFKFYCLLQNCSFLYSSDSIGLENHFMCEHSQIKWNGYCLMCQAHCFPNDETIENYSISKEIRHMLDKHANKPHMEINTDTSTQHSTTSSLGNEEKPKIKIRRLTGDCLSRAVLESASSNQIIERAKTLTNSSTVPMSMLGALLVAKPKPPTKEMPPQPQMPLTEPLLLDNNSEIIKASTSSSAFKNVGSEFLITSVTSAATLEKQSPLQISSVISLQQTPTVVNAQEEAQVPKIVNVRTLASKDSNLWSQQIETKHQELVGVPTESLEVSKILANADCPSTQIESSRGMDDSPGPIVVAETVPLTQNKSGDFLITQTVSAQYNEFASTAVDFNISIAATSSEKSIKDTLPIGSSTPITSRHYKCMGTGCKFISRVPVAMCDHLRFHERRNFSNKRDYFDCSFCSYHASDVDEYMEHAHQYHIINKGGATATMAMSLNSETDSATSLTKKIHDILNGNNNTSDQGSDNVENQLRTQTAQIQDSHDVYLKKLKDTIDEVVGPTGLADDQLYRCVIKNCRTQLTETTFLNHIMYHITTTFSNPNNYMFKCPHCSAQYHRAAGIKAHIKNHARNRYFCYLCEHTATNPGQLLKHFSEKHWHTLNMYTNELLKPKTSTDGSAEIIDSGYYVVYTQELSEEEVKKFGEKLILEWQRKKSGSKTHFKSSEIDLLPMSAIFQREVNCGECEYKTKVRTNMFRHLQMHKQNRGVSNNSGVSKVYNVDPVNPVPCLNSNERFFDKMTNLASSSLTPSTSSASNSSGVNSTKNTFKIPYKYVVDSKRYTCGCSGCNYLTISEDIFRTHLSTLHSSVMSYRCIFCQEEICKRGITIDRIINHLRFHGAIIYRCEECNYVHHLRYVVERHINEKHATSKVTIITHERSEDNTEGITKTLQFTGKKYRETMESSSTVPTSATITRSANNETSNPVSSSSNSIKVKGKWVCDVCGHRASNVNQIQTHCQQQHGVKNQYKCAHCNFGSQQLSQILHHIDEKHSGKTREARYMYHKSVNSNEEVADTRPLWQRNDPTRIRHIRGILMEDEEESEQYRKKLGLMDDIDDEEEEEGENRSVNDEDHNGELDTTNYIKGYEFGCFHCNSKTQIFDDLKTQHHTSIHNSQVEMAKPFWFRLYRRLCCPECRSFIGNCNELQQHIQNVHKKSRYYAADITVAENEDSSHRMQCGYCSFHCANVEHLYRHHLRAQHLPQDIRIDDDKQLKDILALGEAEVSYQCSLCADIFPNRVAIVQHNCNLHAGDSFSFIEVKNSCIYRCISCHFTSIEERDLLRHMVDHYSRFTKCQFCCKSQSTFNVYMQHCYAEHKAEIQKFKTIYSLMEIRKYLLQMLIIFPNGLVLSKRNLLNTKYGNTNLVEELYEEMYKISQQPPIPRLSIARLVARKSIEAQQKHQDSSSSLSTRQTEALEGNQQSRPKNISKRRCTVAVSQEDHKPTNIIKERHAIVEVKPSIISKRRITVDQDNKTAIHQQTEFSKPLQPKNISKRRRTVAVDRDTLFSSNLSSSNFLLNEGELSCKKRKIYTPSPKYTDELSNYPVNLDIEPFSFYGQMPEIIDLSKTYTKVVIGGIKTPLTIDKFKLLFNIECQLKLTKCDQITHTMSYNDYKHIKKACPASHKLKYN